VAALSKVRKTLESSNTGMVGSNPSRGVDVYPHFSLVLSSCVGRGLTMDQSPL